MKSLVPGAMSPHQDGQDGEELPDQGGDRWAGALIVGRCVSKDVAKDIASKTVVAGATGCLSSLA
ncbi:hypothetical protein [Streptomyces decoyicus]|uniref:hypothetical protein n=1 Tax=Streptomyces decoyicus TaxID=249567 RepID=UPI0033AB9AB3